MTPRSNPSTEHFPVQVCEALFPAEKGAEVAGSGIQLPPIAARIEQVTVFGDTGCKPKKQNGCHENSSRHWPFHRMASAAADPRPDLVLHMGDYNYRGTPGSIRVNGKKVPVYDAGDNTSSVTCRLAGPYIGQNSEGSGTPDQWSNWWSDFFRPAQKLLQAAPWVVARGNHELCSRAGPGWFYLLDPGSALLGEGESQLACPPAEANQPLVFQPPYRVDLGGISVVALDSANACDQGSLHQSHFDRQFEQIQSLVEKAPAANRVWLHTHRPLWAVKKADSTTPKQDLDPSGTYEVIDHTLQQAYAKHPLPRPLQLVLSGHMHRFQAIGFPPTGNDLRPPQLVVGNGGVALAGNHPKQPFSLSIDGMTGIGFGISEFGYMTLQLGHGDGWKGQLLDREAKQMAVCDSSRLTGTGICAPAE